MKKLLLLFVLVLPLRLWAQQLPERSPFGETGFLWNPAMTAPWTYYEIDAGFRQEWLGFEDAPQTAYLGIQYPFEKENMSLGGYFMHDAINPIKTNTFALTYAYKLEPGFKRYDQLSIGLMGSVTHIFVDGLDIVVKDPDDDYVPVGENNKLSPNVGFGLFYISQVREPYKKNALYAGLGCAQSIPSNVIFDQTGSLGNFKRALHGNALFGARIIKESMLLEPSIWVNYSVVNRLNVNLSFRIEQFDSFWAGLTYTTNQTLAVQVGSVFNKGFVKDGSLRVGLLGSYNIGTFGQARGLGFECYLAYRFEL